MKDEQFDKSLERVLEFIYRVEEKARKELETQQFKYRNDQFNSNGKYQHNIDTSEEK